MMVFDGGLRRRQSELMQEHGIYGEDGISLTLRHGIASFVEITQIFQADPVGVGSFNAGRNGVEAPSGHDGAIGEQGEMLGDFGEPSFQMGALHALLQGQMISSLEMAVVRNECMVILYQSDQP